METKEQITDYCRKFRTAGIANNPEVLVKEAEDNAFGFMEFTLHLLKTEAAHRYQNEVKRRRKVAKLPLHCDLDHYDHTFNSGVSKTRLNQLRELNWLDQGYNLMLMGPSGVGKTLLASGLCSDAIDKGYKAYFRTMEDLVNMLKMKDITRAATADYKRLTKADLIVIDDIMLLTCPLVSRLKNTILKISIL
ncbi:MAG: ATP-binding protein [Eudoraea sp.]|nr:ATP-binding protein [Eudoraea sp.]